MKKVSEELDYYKQQSRNEFAFREMLKVVKPDLFVLFDLLESTNVNVLVLLKIIRHIKNIDAGNGYGTISINIENGRVMFIKGEESDKVNEPAVVERKKTIDK